MREAIFVDACPFARGRPSGCAGSTIPRPLLTNRSMHIEHLSRLLDSPAAAESWLRECGVEDPRRAHANLVGMAAAGVTLDLLANIIGQLQEHLALASDPDMALNNLGRFIAAARNPLGTASLLERDPEALPALLQIFSSSQYLSDLLISDTESYDLLRLTEGQPVNRETLVEEISAEVQALDDETAVMEALRRFKRRETLRICYGDLIRGQRLDVVTRQVSYLADAIVEAALRYARRALEEKRGRPTRPNGQPARFVVLGMGKLGGAELNYSSDIDLVLLYDADGDVLPSRRITNGEFFDRLARETFKLLTDNTPLGQAYRVDLRLRPEGQRGPLVIGLEAAYQYYDVLGRTWERQAYVKARAVAGDLELGKEFLSRLEPWIYRRYLGLADITGIKALKRRIEHRATVEGGETRDVKTGRGGIRDVEFAIQFLQLLNGGDLPQLRTGNTLEALARLEEVGCLNHQERGLLEQNYTFLRNIEHRLQIMFDLQTHLLPTEPEERRKVAIRMGYVDQPRGRALEAFTVDFDTRTEQNRRIFDHLLRDAFPDDAETGPEVDLVLDPDPRPEAVAQTLSRYGFRDVELAYRNLISLSSETVRFLSTRRCRHFLAAIAPQLLTAIAATPDPDSTLVNLEKVSDSLGGKGVLWELFSFNPPSLKLYVDVCAYSPLLSNILISNPGMIDELMDSLVLNRLPTRENLRGQLADLCRAAEDIEPILHSFKNGEQLRVGVRDILGKEDFQAVTAALSSIAQVCLEQITRCEFEKLADKLGEPTIGEEGREGQPAELVILALGKFGGAELNYHSDLDLVFLYEADGMTVPRRKGRNGPARAGNSTSNQHFFSELGQRIIKVANHLGPYGRLYEVDPRLRPTGRSGALTTSFSEFARYFAEGEGQLWERQALCRARVVYGADDAAQTAGRLVDQAALDHDWSAADAAGIRDMRQRLEETAGKQNFKRGPGGIVDVEFLVQLLQLKHGRQRLALRQPNTLAALGALHEAGHLSSADAESLERHYRYLRSLEGRLRLMGTTARNDLPEEPAELSKLARMMGAADAQRLTADVTACTREVRDCFERLVSREMK